MSASTKRQPARQASTRSSKVGLEVVYLASALGFTDAGDALREELHSMLTALEVDVLDPWDVEVPGPLTREKALALGALNFDAIRRCDRVLAIVDGADVDSGVACELGFGRALGKRCDGLRTDLRLSGECPTLGLNLQVASAIFDSGGLLLRRLEDLPVLFDPTWAVVPTDSAA